MADTQRQWLIAVATGGFRLSVGAGLVGLRGFGARVLGAGHDDRVLPAMLAGFGIRDAALGLSAIASTRPGASVARQVRLQAACDLFDAGVGAGLIATGKVSRGPGYAIVGVSLLAAVIDHLIAMEAARSPGLALAG